MKRSPASALVGLALAACSAAPHAATPPAAAPPAQAATPRTLDDFERAGLWGAVPASGVEMRLGADAGHDGGSALRVDFDFRGGGGWAALRRELPVTLPENYELSFWIRAEAPKNTLEFKLVDPSGENVWWVHRPEFEFQGGWRRVVFRKRHVAFAWGPARGGEIRNVGALEFAITAGTGGRGTVWIDDLTLTSREPVRPYDLVPEPVASSHADGASAARALDGNGGTSWRSATGDVQQFTIDFLRLREFGGLRVDWQRPHRAVDYDVEVSADGRVWERIRSVRAGGRDRDYLVLPETETRWLRLRMHRSESGAGYAVREIEVLPLEWAASRNRLFESLAADAPRGHYPKYFTGVQSYWTVVGVSGDDREALLDAQGMLEVDKRAFSVEPFLYADERLLTWSDGTLTPSLERGDLPIPSVRREAAGLALTVTAWADGEPGASTLWARYRVENLGSSPRAATLYLALRPFQVNPSWQFLNNPGGAAVVRSVAFDGERVAVNDARQVVPVTHPAGFGAATFEQGDVVDWLRRGALPPSARVNDDLGHASAALAYPLELAPGESRDVYIAAPFHAAAPPVPTALDPAEAARLAEASRAATAARWAAELDRFSVELPGAAARIGRSLKSNLAYILINRDGPAIQPGSRSYERSWIRDGSLTSAALLRLGHAEEVRRFIEWYAPFQYAGGKVPCCVDHRGADPVPENDSHGQLVYLVAEYFRHTGDRALIERAWPHVERAVLYMDSLRQSRRTAEYRTREKRAFFGLLPESISHEGYSEKPMHSYWDQFFALKGLGDAVELAAALGREDERERFAAIRDEFRTELMESFRQAMQSHGIDYLPGSVELGDFDATSTTVGVAPGGATTHLPADALRRTFGRYWDEALERREGRREWEAYTPYELRTIGTFVRLGERRRAHALLDWFFEHQRPAAWNHWAEVVFRDPDAPRFIGDMPHTWVGSDYIRSVTDMFAYERDADGALVLGAGVLPEWVASGDGIAASGLRTHYGVVGYTMRRRGDEVVVRFTGELRAVPGGIVLRSPLERPIRAATVDGHAVAAMDNELRLEHLPREVVLRY